MNINHGYKEDDKIVLIVYPNLVGIFYNNIQIWSHTCDFTNERICHIAKHAKFIYENIDASGLFYTICELCKEKITEPYDHFEAQHLPLTKSANKN